MTATYSIQDFRRAELLCLHAIDTVFGVIHQAHVRFDDECVVETFLCPEGFGRIDREYSELADIFRQIAKTCQKKVTDHGIDALSRADWIINVAIELRRIFRKHAEAPLLEIRDRSLTPGKKQFLREKWPLVAAEIAGRFPHAHIVDKVLVTQEIKEEILKTEGVVEHCHVDKPDYCFRQKGDFWEVRFDGQETFIKDMVGCNYVVFLLNNPKKWMHSLDILHVTDDRLRTSESVQESSDIDALKAIQKEMHGLQVEVDRLDDDDPRVSDLKIQIEKLEAQAKCDFRWMQGKINPRQIKNSAEYQASESIRKAMEAVKKKLRDPKHKVTRLADHLDCVSKDRFRFQYNPPTEIAWEF